jgi:membrane-associated phospholipid phosphatase
MFLRLSRPPVSFAALIWVALLVLTTGGVYLLAVQTAWGQYLDQRAYLTLLGSGASADLPHVVGLGSITDYRLWVVAAALVVGLGLLAGRRWSVAALLALPVAGILVVQFLRDDLLIRPDLAGDGWLTNTFPSGHAAAAAGCVAAIVRSAPRRGAPLVAVLGVGWLTLVGQDLMVWGWHRPSDLIGSVLVAAAIMHLVPASTADDRRTDHGRRTAVVTAMAAAVGPVLWAVGTGHLAVVPVGLTAAAAIASLVADGGAAERRGVRGVTVGTHHERIKPPGLSGAQQDDHRRATAHFD